MSSTDVSDLEAFGIEDLGGGICEDTPINKKILRGNKFAWETVWEEDGSPSGKIKTFHGEALVERRDSTWERRKPIMVDPDDRYSDYVGPEDYPPDFADAPWWVNQRLTWWINLRLGRIQPNARNSQPFPTRCELVRPDGTRCWNWTVKPAEMPRCKPHAGWMHDVEKQHALITRQKLLEAMPDAADTMIALAADAEGEAVRLKATELILSIGGVRAGQDIDLRVTEESGVDPTKTVRDRLERLTAAAESERKKLELAQSEAAADESASADIVEAVIISDEAEKTE